jgi:hypothetical protein
MRSLLLFLLLPLLTLVSACSVETDASAPATSTPAPRTTAAAQPVFARPPTATASAGGTSVTMGIGTYCWGAPGQNGVCIDAAGPVTGVEELVVAAGSTVDVTTAFSGAEIEEAVASSTAIEALQGSSAGPNELVWNLRLTDSQQFTTTQQTTGVSFPAPAEPGRYLVSLFLRPDAGDVAYGVVLDVR